MRIVVIGGTGTIGSAVVERAREQHEVLVVGKTSGEHQVDLVSQSSIRRLLSEIGKVDAIVSAAGVARFGRLAELSDEDFRVSVEDKLMGQVNLIRLGVDHIRDGGSITVTTGVLAREPIVGSAAISLVNAGLDGFVGAAALELPRNVRVNAVSPPWVAETLEAMGRDTGDGMPATEVARAYLSAIEGDATGTTIDARSFHRGSAAE